MPGEGSTELTARARSPAGAEDALPWQPAPTREQPTRIGEQHTQMREQPAWIQEQPAQMQEQHTHAHHRALSF